MKNWTVRKRITTSYPGIGIVLGVLCLYTFTQLRGIERTTSQIVAEDRTAVYAIGRIERIATENFALTLKRSLTRRCRN